MYRKHDSTMSLNAINCMNYQISIDKHLRPDNYVNQHRFQFDNHVDKLGQHLRLVAENVILVTVVAVLHYHPIPNHYSVEVLLHLKEQEEKQI